MRAPKSMSQCFVASWTIVLVFVCPLESIAQTAKYDDSHSIQGFSQPGRIASVAAAIPGIVRAIHVREGSIVADGDTLVKLDRGVHDEKLNLARLAKDAQGELQSAQAELNAGVSRLRRIQELADRQHATPSELLQAREDVEMAKANLRRAEDRREQQIADYQRLVAEADQFAVKAPFTGVVVELKKELGEFVGPGESTVCIVADLSTLSVEFMVPRYLLHHLEVDDRIEILFTYANRVVPGTIEYISPYPNGETNTYTLKARVANTDGKLTAGERCQIETKSLSQKGTKPHRSAQRIDNPNTSPTAQATHQRPSPPAQVATEEALPEAQRR
ncbi:MAG: efflux RND transporter periplasmic adaptor subunit [Pirellulaceae bacterium]